MSTTALEVPPWSASPPRAQIGAGAGAYAGRHAETAIAAAAAHALRHQAIRARAGGADRIAGAGERHVCGVAAVAAIAAHGDAQIAARQIDGTGDRKTAIATAAADTLGEDAVGIIATRDDGIAAVDGDGTGVIARTAGATHRQLGGGRKAYVPGHAESAVTAAAADALRDQPGRIVCRPWR